MQDEEVWSPDACPRLVPEETLWAELTFVMVSGALGIPKVRLSAS